MTFASTDALNHTFDVCVVGSGPAGLACALSCRERGLSVLVLEAGGEHPTPGRPDVLAADISDPNHHDPTDIVAASALGGTSHWWGGRAVQFDALDFNSWPIDAEAMAPWYGEARAFLGAYDEGGRSVPARFSTLKNFDATRDEIWCGETNIAQRWRDNLVSEDGPVTLLNARVLGLAHAEHRVTSLKVRVGNHDCVAHARHVVLACGGLGSLRLMLLAQRDAPALFGGPDGPLGRGYMGHLMGEIADFAPTDRAIVTDFGFRPLGHHIYARRRIHARADAMRRENIGPIAFWLDEASNADAAHGSSVASAKYLAARALRAASGAVKTDEQPLRPHFQNIARAPVSAVTGLGRAAYLLTMRGLTGRMPRPRSLLQTRDGAWALRYHAEQKRDPENRVSLSTESRDSVGLPKLDIQFKYDDHDAERVVRAHELLNDDLAAVGAGRLQLRAPREECAARVKECARDGYHQLGGAMMHDDPKQGVVDAQCRVHGMQNLWVASSSVFPTGSHANPTLTIVALSLRIADTLANLAPAGV